VISEDEFLKSHVLHIRELASKADPFIKHRLLNLASNYERRLSNPPRKLPSVDISQDAQD